MTPPAERARLVAANDDAADFYRRTLLGPEGDGPRRYLTDRGFAALLDDTQWTVGYAPAGWTRLRDHLIHLGYREETLAAAGLTRISSLGNPIDSFRDRITFGIRDLDGDLVGFTARCAPGAPTHVPRYLNTRATVIYDKSRVLFGLGEEAGCSRGAVVLTEGPLDAIAADLSNDSTARTAVFAVCGTALTNDHRNAIAALVPLRIVLAFDGDDAGRRASENAYRVLKRIADVDAIEDIGKRDVADVLSSEGPEAVHRVLEGHRPAFDAIIDARLASWPNRSESAEAAIACLRSIARLVADLEPEDVARPAIRLRDSLKVPTTVITRELADAIAAPRRPTSEETRSPRGGSLGAARGPHETRGPHRSF